MNANGLTGTMNKGSPSTIEEIERIHLADGRLSFEILEITADASQAAAAALVGYQSWTIIARALAFPEFSCCYRLPLACGMGAACGDVGVVAP